MEGAAGVDVGVLRRYPRPQKNKRAAAAMATAAPPALGQYHVKILRRRWDALEGLPMAMPAIAPGDKEL